MMNAGFVQRDSNGVWGPGPNVSQTQGQWASDFKALTDHLVHYLIQALC